MPTVETRRSLLADSYDGAPEPCGLGDPGAVLHMGVTVAGSLPPSGFAGVGLSLECPTQALRIGISISRSLAEESHPSSVSDVIVRHGPLKTASR